MKIFFLVLLVVTLSNSFAFPTPERTNDTFDRFVSRYGKSFANSLDKQRRFEVFSKNMREINEFNKMAEKNNIPYRQGMNPFTELDFDEFVSLYTGLRYEPNATLPDTVATKTFAKKTLGQSSVPSSKNWVAEGKVTYVRNQGSCGGCWAFATVTVLETLNAIKYGVLVPLSEQQLMDCNYDTSKGNWACQGGYFSNAFSYARSNGVMRNTDYPYLAQRSTCKYAKTKAVSNTYGFGYGKITNENDLKTIVGTVGPVAVGIYVSQSLQRYTGGILDDASCLNRAPTHGVTVVGYGSQGGRDFWIVRNSWGPSWGESGYFRMIRNKNMCNLLSMAYYADFD